LRLRRANAEPILCHELKMGPGDGVFHHIEQQPGRCYLVANRQIIDAVGNSINQSWSGRRSSRAHAALPPWFSILEQIITQSSKGPIYKRCPFNRADLFPVLSDRRQRLMVFPGCSAEKLPHTQRIDPAGFRTRLYRQKGSPALARLQTNPTSSDPAFL
jgi:hypothetical protein